MQAFKIQYYRIHEIFSLEYKIDIIKQCWTGKIYWKPNYTYNTVKANKFCNSSKKLNERFLREYQILSEDIQFSSYNQME